MSAQECTDQPQFRATIAKQRLTIVPWHPQLLISGGSRRVPFRACEHRGVAIADFTIIRQPGEPLELLVGFLTSGEQAGVRDTLVRWATALAYGRIWLGDDVIEIVEEIVSSAELASTECAACGTRWEEHEPEFWRVVRDLGVFPMSCPVCGGDLPQWEVHPDSTMP